MQHVIGCDVHKRYSVFVAIDHRGRLSKPDRVEHEREMFRAYLQTLPPGSEIAIEATGHWYWIVDEMEQAGHRPHLANPFEAKKRMGKPNKHDALDAGGLAILLRNGTLPESWIPPRDLRDVRELLRTRMALRDLRTSLKHRIHAAIDRYGLHNDAVSDLFGKSGRDFLLHRLTGLPPETYAMLLTELAAMDDLEPRISAIERRIGEVIVPTPEVQLLLTLPGVGPILAPLLWLEIGDVERFPPCREPGQLCRSRAQGLLQWRPHRSRPHQSSRQPLPALGLHRGCHLRRAPARLPRQPHRPAVPAPAPHPRLRPGYRRRGPPSRGGQLLDAPQTAALPAAKT